MLLSTRCLHTLSTSVYEIDGILNNYILRALIRCAWSNMLSSGHNANVAASFSYVLGPIFRTRTCLKVCTDELAVVKQIL